MTIESMQEATFVNLQYLASEGNSSFLLMQIILLQSVHKVDEEYPFLFANRFGRFQRM